MYSFIEDDEYINKQTIWDQVCGALEKEIGGPRMTSVFSRVVPLGITQDGEFVVGVHNKFNHDVIQRFHADTIDVLLHDITGLDMRLRVETDSDLAESVLTNSAPLEIEQHGYDEPITPAEDAKISFDQKYTFESFVVGDTNNFAYSAALAVAEQPGLKYNPLFIWGGPGLGKTHLLQAIGSYITNSFPYKKVTYITTEELVNQFTSSLTTKDKNVTDYLRTYYRGADVLILDDIQFLENKQSTIDFFFHTFNDLKGRGKQIIIASDRSPGELKMNERYTSRFKSGLIVDIQPPTYEVRLAILKKYTSRLKIEFDYDAISYIAERSSGNIREMEGAITRSTAFAELSNKDRVDIKLIEIVTADYFLDQTKRPISIATIQKEVCRYYGISHTDLIGSKRKQDLVYPRHIAMYLCQELTDSSFPKIGDEFGGKDHTTVMHAAAKIKKKMSSENETYKQIQHLTNVLHNKPI